MTDGNGQQWKKLGEFLIASHRQLPLLDREIKHACRTAGMDSRKARELMTSYRELCSNMIDHAGKGRLSWYSVAESGKVGLGLIAEDEGAGIVDLDQAMVDGYSTGRGLGLGLGGVSRMMDHMIVDSTSNKGTRITAIKWI